MKTKCTENEIIAEELSRLGHYSDAEREKARQAVLADLRALDEAEGDRQAADRWE